ncbi:hypothetical protein PAUR_a2171 [Pseudoalteromonas aurantia 208]|uniref:Orphan protein n=1 Tax=Pseudoalteromonas aurantia 208 TaxID=1314867 RepID=A0ABR9EC20_9GAMM|nr:hypothetical protein [Pseudoalteromonas aurantia 208]
MNLIVCDGLKVNSFEALTLHHLLFAINFNGVYNFILK